jgi:hypothetical protein
MKTCALSFLLICISALRLGASDPDTAKPPAPELPPAVLPFLPRPPVAETSEGVDWPSLMRASGRFLAVEHAFRLATEPGTRAGLKGSFFGNYARAVGSIHGWSDGDEFYVNYVGHPAQGAVAGFLWVANDGKYSRTPFANTRAYWKSRLRAAGFAFLYSAQFEIGPVSEASVGAIQAVPPQVGLVDHVITPTLGMAWMVAEDALDKHLIERIEAATTNRYVRLLARGGLNPTRTFANVLRGKAPWNRETRDGILTYRRWPSEADRASGIAPEAIESPGPAPFELGVTMDSERLSGGGKPTWCVGGNGKAAVRLAPAWQLVIEAGGCKMLDMAPNYSGDSVTYMIGPRWVSNGSSQWTAYWQVLVGGNKLTQERAYPERKAVLERVAARNHAPPPSPDLYTDKVETHGVALAAGGGVDYKLNRALAIRVAELSYRHSWVGALWGRTHSEGVKFASGLVFRIGSW